MFDDDNNDEPPKWWLYSQVLTDTLLLLDADAAAENILEGVWNLLVDVCERDVALLLLACRAHETGRAPTRRRLADAALTRALAGEVDLALAVRLYDGGWVMRRLLATALVVTWNRCAGSEEAMLATLIHAGAVLTYFKLVEHVRTRGIGANHELRRLPLFAT